MKKKGKEEMSLTPAMVLSCLQLEEAVARISEKGGGKAWLTVGIPTIPRKTGVDYLTRTLETLLEDLPLDPTDPLYGKVRVLVMNNRPGNHTVFNKVFCWHKLTSLS